MLSLAPLLLAAPAALPQTQFAEPRRVMPKVDALLGDGLVGDLDGDGHVDVLYVTPDDDYLLYGSAATVFRDGSADLPAFASTNTAAALGDLNGDGAPDLVVTNDASDADVYLNQAGVLTPHATLPIRKAVGVALSDLDSDGDLDVVIASNDAGTNSQVYLGDGAGNFALHVSGLPGGFGGVLYRVLAEDFNNDGHDDLYFSDSNGDRMLFGSAAATYAEPAFSPFSHTTTTASTGDANADGNADLFLGDYLGLSYFALGDGSGQFGLAPANGVVLPERSRFVDVNADGWDDVLVFGNGAARYFQSLGNGSFFDASGDLASTLLQTPAVGDLDGDGDVDIMSQGIPGLWLRGPGGFVDQYPRVPAWKELWLVNAAGDLDGDGDDDVMTPYGTVFFADHGELTASDSYSVNFSDEVVLADVDGDGDLDAAFPRTVGVQIARNDGAGGFSTVGTSQAAEHALDLDAGDVDGDGDVDLVFTRDWSTAWTLGLASCELLLNDGAGNYTAGSVVPTLPEAFRPKLVDLDGDGDLDLILAAASAVAFENDGAGNFAATPAFLPAGIAATSVAVGDVDSDGDMDAVFTRLTDDLLFLNDGTGALLPAAPGMLPAPNAFSARAQLVDADADGDLDLFTFGSEHRYYAGDGAGSFAQPETFSQGTTAGAVTLDLDGDGDLDVVGGGYGGTGAWTNVGGGQTARRTGARIGKPIQVQVYGEVGSNYFLAVAPFAASIPIPFYGLLELDPATLVLVDSGLIPSAGVAATDVPVPATPLLVGHPIYWQSIVGTPLALVNSEAVVVSDL